VAIAELRKREKARAREGDATMQDCLELLGAA
jgi:hypothetical protein